MDLKQSWLRGHATCAPISEGLCIFILHGTLKIMQLILVLKLKGKMTALEFLFRRSFKANKQLVGSKSQAACLEATLE